MCAYTLLADEVAVADEVAILDTGGQRGVEAAFGAELRPRRGDGGLPDIDGSRHVRTGEVSGRLLEKSTAASGERRAARPLSGGAVRSRKSGEGA